MCSRMQLAQTVYRTGKGLRCQKKNLISVKPLSASQAIVDKLQALFGHNLARPTAASTNPRCNSTLPAQQGYLNLNQCARQRF